MLPYNHCYLTQALLDSDSTAIVCTIEGWIFSPARDGVLLLRAGDSAAGATAGRSAVAAVAVD